MSIKKRIDNVTGIPDEYRSEILPAPISVKIELTAKCNYRCVFCGQPQNLREKKNMDFDLYKRIVKEMLDAGVKEIGVFFLGESFLYPKLPEAIEYTKNLGCEYVFITTNGSIASPSKVEACMRAGLDSLKWSFNYADADQLHEIARVKKSYFGKMLSNIKDAHAVRAKGNYNCGLYASYIAYDGGQGERMRAAVNEIKEYVDEVYALPLYSQASFATKEEEKKGWKPTPGNRGRIGALRDPLPCWSVLSEGHVTATGHLGACCFSHTDIFDMADLKEVGFMEGWNSLKFQELRRAHLKKDVTGTPCEKCVIYE